MNGKNSVFVGAIVLVLVMGLAIWRLQSPQPLSGGARSIAGGGGPMAPEGVSRTLDGVPWRLSEQRGKVVLIDFWATWCGPCIASMPHLKQVYDRFSANPDFVMVGVSDDYGEDAVRRFVAQNQIRWTQLYEAKHEMARAFGITGIPSAWVIDREGRVVGRDLHGEEIDRAVEKALAMKS